MSGRHHIIWILFTLLIFTLKRKHAADADVVSMILFKRQIHAYGPALFTLKYLSVFGYSREETVILNRDMETGYNESNEEGGLQYKRQRIVNVTIPDYRNRLTTRKRGSMFTICESFLMTITLDFLSVLYLCILIQIAGELERLFLKDSGHFLYMISFDLDLQYEQESKLQETKHTRSYNVSHKKLNIKLGMSVTTQSKRCYLPATKVPSSHMDSTRTYDKVLDKNEISKTSKQRLDIFDLLENCIPATKLRLYPFTGLDSYLKRKTTNRNTPDEEMSYEARRLQSFNATVVKTSSLRLAQSGFYATGNGDETQCYSCSKTYRNWQMMDKPDVIHRIISPDCPHINRRDARNIPFSSTQADENVTRVAGLVQEYPLIQTSTESSVYMSEGAAASTLQPTLSGHLNESEAPDIAQAVYPQYRALQIRLDSYQGWGWSHIQDPRVLAAAGFYYAGYRDCVRCFYCGVGLRTWEKEDDPWVEHVRWRSSCAYVRSMRGEQYVIGALAVAGQSDPSPSLPAGTTSSYNQQEPTVVDIIAKAEEMGFTRESTETAIEELIQGHNPPRGTGEIKRQKVAANIGLEILIEKLVLTDQETTANPSMRTEETHLSLPTHQLSTRCSSGTRGPDTTTDPRVTVSVVPPGTQDSCISSLPGGRSLMTDERRNMNKASETNENDEIATIVKDEQNKKQGQSWQNNTAPDQTSLATSFLHRQLEEENQSLRDESTCKVCLDNPSCIVFLPCGHLVTCAECAPALRKCPVCRALIRGTVRAYGV